MIINNTYDCWKMIVKKLKLVCLTHSGGDASGMVADNVDNEIVQVCSGFKYAQKRNTTSNP